MIPLLPRPLALLLLVVGLLLLAAGLWLGLRADGPSNSGLNSGNHSFVLVCTPFAVMFAAGSEDDHRDRGAEYG